MKIHWDQSLSFWRCIRREECLSLQTTIQPSVHTTQLNNNYQSMILWRAIVTEVNILRVVDTGSATGEDEKETKRRRGGNYLTSDWCPDP
jgi:hypothetical protein